MPLDMHDAWLISTLEFFPIGRVQAQGCRADDGPATYGLLIDGGLWGSYTSAHAHLSYSCINVSWGIFPLNMLMCQLSREIFFERITSNLIIVQHKGFSFSYI